MIASETAASTSLGTAASPWAAPSGRGSETKRTSAGSEGLPGTRAAVGRHPGRSRPCRRRLLEIARVLAGVGQHLPDVARRIRLQGRLAELTGRRGVLLVLVVEHRKILMRFPAFRNRRHRLA